MPGDLKLIEVGCIDLILRRIAGSLGVSKVIGPIAFFCGRLACGQSPRLSHAENEWDRKSCEGRQSPFREPKIEHTSPPGIKLIGIFDLALCLAHHMPLLPWTQRICPREDSYC